MSDWIRCDRERFDAFVAAYPRPLRSDVARIFEPPVLTYNDFANGAKWPDSVVARADVTADGSLENFVIKQIPEPQK